MKGQSSWQDQVVVLPYHQEPLAKVGGTRLYARELPREWIQLKRLSADGQFWIVSVGLQVEGAAICMVQETTK